MKKILFITNISDGVGSFSIASLLAAQSCGMEFHLAGNFSNASSQKLEDDTRKYNIKIHNINIMRSPFNIGNLKAFYQLVKIINEEKIDYIHCNTPVGGMLGRIIGKKCNVKKVIYQVHGFHFYNGAPLVNKTIFKWAEIIMAHWTDVIITINKEDFEAAKKFRLKNNGNVFYVPGVGISVNDYKHVNVNITQKKISLGLNNNDFILISVGRLDKNKNIYTIVNAMSKLNNNKIHLLLCGDGEEKLSLKMLAEKEGIESNVHFLGNRSDMIELYSIADVFVMSSYREGLSRSIMEAMASGLPCIVSKIRGNVDLIKDGFGGYLVEPDNADAYSNRIQNLLDDSKLRKQMSNINLNVIKKYDIQIVKKEIAKIYCDVLL